MSHICKLINGKALADDIQEKLAKKVANFRVKPKLAVILVGHDPRSEVYVEFKKKACRQVGIDIETIELEENCTELRLKRVIDGLNSDKETHGVLVQLPLPGQIDEKEIVQMIAPAKDVDGFNPVNMGKLVANVEGGIVPASVKGIMKLIDSLNIDLSGKEVAVVGAGYLVGRPLANLLINKGATVVVCNSNTKNLAEHTKKADILISAVGKPGLITKEMIKPESVIIDAGITKTEDGVLGDVVFEDACEVARYVTPVPGGVGPMTVAMLLENTWQVMRLQGGYEDY